MKTLIVNQEHITMPNHQSACRVTSHVASVNHFRQKIACHAADYVRI